MKNNWLLFGFTILLSGILCSQEKDKRQNVSSIPYFENHYEGIQSGNIKMVPIETPKGSFKVWTKRIGNNPKIKVLLVNGGPGLTHEYFECFENFFPQKGIEFIYYDQLACGNSDNPKDTTLFDLGRYVEEVETVRKSLGLNKDNFYLLGHSWGGIVAMEYALKYQGNMKGMVISNMMASCPEYGKYAHEVLAKQMDPKILAEIMDIEKRGDFNSPRYMELLMPHFYAKHVLRLPEAPEPFLRSMSKLNHELYVTMQGPSEFGISGKLEKWDVSKKLKNIRIPTLVIGAAHDTMDPKYMEWMSTEFPKGEFLLCKEGSHMAMYDDQQTYFNGLVQFLKKEK